MKKPHLVIFEEIGRVPVQGGCSYREHFRKVHMREDASQAAARIVREATEDK